jgi:hypothetical protein
MSQRVWRACKQGNATPLGDLPPEVRAGLLLNIPGLDGRSKTTLPDALRELGRPWRGLFRLPWQSHAGVVRHRHPCQWLWPHEESPTCP